MQIEILLRRRFAIELPDDIVNQLQPINLSQRILEPIVADRPIVSEIASGAFPSTHLPSPNSCYPGEIASAQFPKKIRYRIIACPNSVI